jgi:hypothetical protein
MRALAARRRRRRRHNVITGVAAAVAVATLGASIGIAFSNNSSNSGGGGTPNLKLGALTTLGPLRSAPSAGPENVPIPTAAQLAGTSGAATGAAVDGIKCDTSEQTLFHIHAHLTIIATGSPRQVPAGIGIPGAQSQNNAAGPFVSNGTCFYYLHTHAADGVIHIESPIRRTYTLGDFFDEWGQPLGPG